MSGAAAAAPGGAGNGLAAEIAAGDPICRADQEMPGWRRTLPSLGRGAAMRLRLERVIRLDLQMLGRERLDLWRLSIGQAYQVWFALEAEIRLRAPHRVICAWCSRLISDGREPISHGICGACAARGRMRYLRRPK
jgi:hypothetical protein